MTEGNTKTSLATGLVADRLDRYINNDVLDSLVTTTMAQHMTRPDAGLLSRIGIHRAQTPPEKRLSFAELGGDIACTDESLEDSVEVAGADGAIEVLLTMLAEQIGRDLTELLVDGDTTSEDEFLAQMDGTQKLGLAQRVIKNPESIIVVLPKRFGMKHEADRGGLRISASFWVALIAD